MQMAAEGRRSSRVRRGIEICGAGGGRESGNRRPWEDWIVLVQMVLSTFGVLRVRQPVRRAKSRIEGWAAGRHHLTQR